MTKPTFRAAPPSKWDVSLDERAVRALQDSALHLFTIHCLADDPDNPDPNACIMFTVVAVTDGRRGFLLLCEDFAPPDTDAELADYMQGVYRGAPRGDDYVCRAATFFELGKPRRGILDLTDPDTARAAIEAAYEEAFRGRGAIDHAAFLESFAWLNVRPGDEASARQFCSDLDGYNPDFDPNAEASVY